MYQLKTETILNCDLEKAWDFFSSPENLSKITPPEMDFRILAGNVDRMYPGMIIQYKVRPLLSIPVEWVTEITHVRDFEFFVDEQRIGPYKMWHHEHHFEKVQEGVKMTDIVSYHIPFGVLGKLANSLFVRSKIDSIFTYREKVIKDLFVSKNEQP
jgi:ligand-binding SRPBCC domain-containing protein